MNKPKMYLTIDVEAKNQHIYNLGYVIHDREGIIVTKGEYLIQEVFESEITNAHYLNRLAISNSLPTVSFWHAITVLQELVEQYKVKCLSMYNTVYDIHALYKTAIHTGNAGLMNNAYNYISNMFLNVEIIDIYPFAVNSILKSQKYYKWVCNQILKGVSVNNFFTPAGHIKTSAENVYQYITNDSLFKQTHTALEDAIIEAKILAACYKQQKKKHTQMNTAVWRIIQEPFKCTLTDILNGNKTDLAEKIQLIHTLSPKGLLC